MRKSLKDIEDTLRNGKLPHANLAQHRHKVWQRVLQAQRERRKSKLMLNLPPWIWVLASIVLILLCVIVMLLIK
ncbi:hypothetical protein GWO43_21165 [candidate division KSB1 bacterium]|nr:hypothetical protein [candidate division KSB1 bacterium]NIR72064.1 hypothetical protein [candidate division KSB1 bacterium]NIS26575.1 hypothetical protein [candidate division KSB1 bacterium]NIT73337.1 hypothetical protein [candidate division KSB1 bacterium]NIU27185.1 hypothetical protein [candidate division KSB1 bacterium]